EPEEMAMIRIDVKVGEQNPQGFMWRRDIEKREKVFGGLDVYLMLDLSGSMAETDPVTGRVKADLQRDFALLYADTLMQCAVVSRKAGGRLDAPLPVRLQVTSIHGGASTDLPLAGEWGPKEQVAMYRSAFQTTGGGTPDHYGLLEIEERIKHEREAWPRKNHKPHEKPPIEFVAVSLDGGSDDPHEARNVAERLRHSGAVVFGYGMTTAARAITATYAPDARVVESLEKHAETVAQDTVGVFKRLYPARVKK
ncbi:MAG TPA: vWA domain-containing protein, partial [Candidatus Methylomirabilis sp.]|nr:vWA domain-containing protein [Candidatus Methylomirabilis sp.]